jgi:hypothetical protein
MKIFILDLWHDLQAKRLWPVALVLGVALVAVPVVVSKPSDAPMPKRVQAVRTAPDPKDLKALTSVKLDDTDAARGSSLDTFDPSDPFRPPKEVTDPPKAEADTPSSVTGQAPGSPSGGSPSSPGGGSPSSPGTGSPGGGGDGGSTTTTTTQYRYVVDVTFAVNGRKRHIEGLERLDMLPSQESPLLLFLGATPSGGNAVFLVDSTLKAAGEGSCKPKPSECAFLYIGAGSEHEFTNDDGDSYTLRIDEIRKVRVGATASAGRAKRAHAAVGGPAETRRFASPLISDEVSVSSEALSDSTDSQDSR